MTTTSIKLTSSWVQVTDGTQAYVVQLVDVANDNKANMTLNDGTPTDSTPAFVLNEGEGFSSITHPGKLWAKVHSGEQVVLVVNK